MNSEWWLILGMMAVTFGVRYPVLALFGRLRLPETVLRALRFVPVAVLSAIIWPATLMPQGELSLDWRNPYLLAALAAVLVSAWRKTLLPTIVVGMLVFALARALL